MSGHGLCPSEPEKWRSVVMASPTPLLARRKEECYCLCLSLFEERGNVVMAILIPLPQRRWEGGYDLCLSVPEKWRSVVNPLIIMVSIILIITSTIKDTK